MKTVTLFVALDSVINPTERDCGCTHDYSAPQLHMHEYRQSATYINTPSRTQHLMRWSAKILSPCMAECAQYKCSHRKIRDGQ